MAESDKIKTSDLIEDNLFQKQIQAAKDFAEASQLVVVGLKEIYKTNLEVLKVKTPVDSKSIKEQSAALVEAEKVRKSIIATELQAEKLKQQQIKTEQQYAKTKRDSNEDANRELGTLEKLAQANKKLADERKRLNLDTQTGKNRLKEINGELDKNNAAIKANSDALGKQRLNIGNYQSALSGLPGALGSVVSGVMQFAQSLKLLLLNPIILIITAISAALYGLFKAFTSTDRGANEFAAAMESLSAIFDIVRKRAILIAGAIADIFNGDFSAAADKFKESIAGVGEELDKAQKAAREYVFALDAIEDSENNYISTRADNAKKIAELEFKAADRSFTIAQRKKFLQEAIKLSEQDFAETRDIASAKYQEELKYFAKLNNLNVAKLKEFITATDEQQAVASKDLKTARENNESKFTDLENLYAKVIQADTDFFNENKRNNAKITAFDDQVEADRKARAEKILKQKEKETKELEELWKEAQDFVDKSLAEEERIRKIDEKKAQEAKDKLLKAQQDLIEFRKAEADYDAEIAKKKQEAEIKRVQDAVANEQKILQAVQQALDEENKTREDALNAQISQREKAISRQFELAKDGQKNQYAWEQGELAKDQLKKKELLKKEAREKEAIQLAQAYLTAYNAELGKAGANPSTAAALALKDVLLAKAIGSSVAALASFFDGTEDTGKGGNIDNKGGFVSVLHPNERVMTAEQNKKIGASKLSNDKLTDIAVKYNTGQLIDISPKYNLERQASFGENIANSIQAQQYGEMNKLLKTIADKPVQMVDVAPIHGRLDMIETLVYNNRKEVITYKGKARI